MRSKKPASLRAKATAIAAAAILPAIAAAIHDATGVWIDEFPFTPERVLRALGKI